MPASATNRVLLATDGSRHAQAAVAFATALAWPPATTLQVASVAEVPVPPGFALGWLAGSGEDWRVVIADSAFPARQRAQATVRDAAATVRAHLPAVTVVDTVRFGEPATELLALCEETHADLLVAGARGQSVVAGLLLGSVSEALVTTAPCPVLIVRAAPSVLDTVLVAVGSVEDADRLAELCLQLPLPPATRLLALTVTTAPAPMPDEERPRADQHTRMVAEWAEQARLAAAHAGERFVARVRHEAPARPVAAEVIEVAHGGGAWPSETPADVAAALLAEVTNRGAGLLIVGARQRQGVAGWLGLGSVSRRLVRRTPGAVLVARHRTTPP